MTYFTLSIKLLFPTAMFFVHSSSTFFRFKKPLKPSLAILGKLEKKLSLMAYVSNVPNLAWDIVSFCSCH